jgi:putative ABC transport system substrate-binding protein
MSALQRFADQSPTSRKVREVPARHAGVWRPCAARSFSALTILPARASCFIGELNCDSVGLNGEAGGAPMRFGGLAGVLLALALPPPSQVHAQTALPVVGYLGSETPAVFASRLASFKAGLAEIGLEEGRDFSIEYRWAESHNERLPGLAAELVTRNVSVIAAPGSVASALAAKATTSTIPVVFETGADPVAAGLVTNLARPSANVTGVTSLNAEVLAKRIELLRQLVPSARTLAVLVNPDNPVNAKATMANAAAASARLGLQPHLINAAREEEFAPAFDSAIQVHADMLVVASETLFNRPMLLAQLAMKHALPCAHQSPEFTRAGGLMSYGGAVTESHRQAGIYVGRILKGERPANLPVQQVTKVEFLVNTRSAKSLGLSIPNDLLLRADEVVE